MGIGGSSGLEDGFERENRRGFGANRAFVPVPVLERLVLASERMIDSTGITYRADVPHPLGSDV